MRDAFAAEAAPADDKDMREIRFQIYLLKNLTQLGED